MARTSGAKTKSVDVKIAAVRLVRSGMSQAAVATAFGVHPSTVSRWWRLARTGGANALALRPVSGRPPKLPPKELRRLTTLLGQPPSQHGLPGHRWTLALIAELIRRTFSVTYHPSHVWRLIRDRGIQR
jgi:putative transposase